MPDRDFSAMDGVLDVTVGYAGGEAEWPTYQNIQDHTEALRVEFDPTIISYAELLEKYFQMTSLSFMPYSRQYRNAILVHDEAQRATAEEVFKRHGGPRTSANKRPFLDIEDATPFYRAEEYHQKYIEKQMRPRSPILTGGAKLRPIPP